MEYKTNILLSNWKADDAKVTISYYVTDVGSVDEAEELQELFDKIVEKRGGTAKESKEKED